jgi:N6-adenosine-specific RNA methylase IME4
MTVPPTPTQIKQAKRAAKEAVLAAKQLALPDRRYGVIVADPPWPFKVYSRETGLDRSAENHYPVQTIEDICALPVSSIAAEDCVLFMWKTVPQLPAGLRVMERWGFKYVSGFVWVKNRQGLGFWARNNVEHLLIGTRGNIPAPAPGTQWKGGNIIFADVRGHSRKPDEAMEMIESYFPSLPKIELHRRGPARPGWDCWGAEAAQVPEQPHRSVANGTVDAN